MTDDNYGCLPGSNNFRRILAATQGDNMPSPEKLYQLPISGDWIAIAQVVAVIAHPERHGCGSDVVVISAPAAGDGEAYLTIPCETYKQACEIRDQIAADRNALLGGC